MKIQSGEDKYKETLMSMWKLCFPADTDEFICFYFDKVYKNDETLLLFEDNSLVASLQMIPYPVKTGHNIHLGGYISGAMTHPDFRKKGYMEKLLNVSFSEMQKKGYHFTFLIPQQDWLFQYYSKFGYEKAFPSFIDTIASVPTEKTDSIYLRDKEVQTYQSIDEIDLNDFYIIYSRFLTDKQNAILKTKKQLENILSEVFSDNGFLLANDWGFAFIFVREDKIVIKEFYCHDEEIKQIFLLFIGKIHPDKEIIIQNNPDAHFLRYKGMIKNLTDSDNPLPKDIYLSMMLD